MNLNAITIIAFLIATIIPLIILYIIKSRDLYQTGSFGWVVLSFAWGGVAFAMASIVNRYLISAGLVERLTIIQFVAPIEEEIFKGLILLYFIRRANFTYFVDGAIYGFAIGIGFAVFENYEYLIEFPNAVLDVAIGRVISTNLIHASASAIVGIGFGLARFKKGIRKELQILLFLILAMLLHVMFNNLVTRVSSGMLLIYAAVVGFSATGVIALSIKKGLRDAKGWIEEKLGMADRVTGGEARVVHKIENIDEILAPLAELFGEEKSSQIERFLLIQARLGILRKVLDKLPDEKLKEETLSEMAELRVEMDEVRREVGTYSMMYLRGIFPEDDSPLWEDLDSVIADRVAKIVKPPGGGVWTQLQRHTSNPPPEGK